MSGLLFDQSLALSGIAQAAVVVSTIAEDGSFDQTAMDTLCDSLFIFDADSTEAIYGSRFGLSTGKRLLKTVFSSSPTAKTQATMGYINGIIALEKQLSKRPELLDVIQTRLQDIERSKETLYSDNEAFYAAVAGVYTDTVSTLSYRVKVTGSPNQLQIPSNADKIRTALFAGIRSAILWRQLGGRRWKLLFQRNRLLQEL